MAVKKLRQAGKIQQHESVILMLTGSGLKDAEVFRHHPINIIYSDLSNIARDLDQCIHLSSKH